MAPSKIEPMDVLEGSKKNFPASHPERRPLRASSRSDNVMIRRSCTQNDLFECRRVPG